MGVISNWIELHANCALTLDAPPASLYRFVAVRGNFAVYAKLLRGQRVFLISSGLFSELAVSLHFFPERTPAFVEEPQCLEVAERGLLLH